MKREQTPCFRRKRLLVLTVVCLLVLSACQKTPVSESDVQTAEPVSNTGKFTIVHTNDVHSHVDIEPYVKSYVNNRREEGEEVILVSAGDAFAGTTFALLSDGLDVAAVMNDTGYELFTLGNHETAMEAEQLRAAMAAVDFPVLAANAADVDETLPEIVPQLQSYVIRELAGEQVAFIGLTAIMTSSADQTDGVRLVEVLEQTKKDAEQAGATLFIGLFHTGITATDETNRSTYLAENCPWLTAIIDAHCHTAHENGLYEGEVLIAEAGEYGANIGVVEIMLQDGEVTEKTASLIPIGAGTENGGITPDAELTGMIADIRERNDAFLSTVIAQIPAALDGERETVRTGETNLGDMVCDALIWYTGADFSSVPCYYLRSSLPQGDFTNELLMNMFLDQDSPLFTHDITGAEIWEVLEESIKTYPEANGYMSQIGGLSFTFDPEAEPGSKMRSVTMADGQLLDPEAIYKYTSLSEFRLLDVRDDVVERPFAEEEKTLQEVFTDYLNSDASFCLEPEGRFLPEQ